MEVGPASVAAPGRAQVARVAGVVSVVEEQERVPEAGGPVPAAVGMEVEEQEQEQVLEAVGQDLVAAVDLEVVVEGSEAAEALELAGELELPAGKPRHRENG